MHSNNELSEGPYYVHAPRMKLAHNPAKNPSASVVHMTFLIEQGCSVKVDQLLCDSPIEAGNDSLHGHQATFHTARALLLVLIGLAAVSARSCASFMRQRSLNLRKQEVTLDSKSSQVGGNVMLAGHSAKCIRLSGHGTAP